MFFYYIAYVTEVTYQNVSHVLFSALFNIEKVLGLLQMGYCCLKCLKLKYTGSFKTNLILDFPLLVPSYFISDQSKMDG